MASRQPGEARPGTVPALPAMLGDLAAHRGLEPGRPCRRVRVRSPPSRSKTTDTGVARVVSERPVRGLDRRSPHTLEQVPYPANLASASAISRSRWDRGGAAVPAVPYQLVRWSLIRRRGGVTNPSDVPRLRLASVEHHCYLRPTGDMLASLLKEETPFVRESCRDATQKRPPR